MSKILHQPHALQACWGLQSAGVQADALALALEHAIFSHLDDFTTAQALAAQRTLDATHTAHLLELLWSMDLLERTPSPPWRWRNRPLARRHLHARSAEYCGDALLFRHRRLRAIGTELGDQLRQGTPKTRAPAAQNAWAQAARQQIAQEQTAVTAPLACALCAALPQFRQMHHFLDLGGGPGLVAIALAHMQPMLRGVVFEQAAVAAVAQDNIARAGLARRLQARGGDLERDALGTDYDLIWCSSVLHFVADIPALLARLLCALRPGGVLLCCHGEIPDAADEARRILPHYLGLRMQGKNVWHQGELAQWLMQCGFAPVQTLGPVPGALTPQVAILAHKPREA